MNRTTRLFTRFAALATTALGLLVVTAGQATAERPNPEPASVGGAHEAPTPVPVQPIVDASVSALQWTLFALAVLGALVIGAALMNLAQRHRGALPGTEADAAVQASS